MTSTKTKQGRIYTGIGGWTYAPWRGGVFYPEGLVQKQELAYASSQVTAIEINGTYYRNQTPTSFAKWHDETPEDFVFSLKASRYITNRRVLAEAGESIDRFTASGLAELRDKLGPVVWQFAPTKQFDAADFEKFLKLLPSKAGRYPLRHALDVRHASFMCEEFIALARRHNAAVVFTDSDDYPSFADLTADFVYVRLMKSSAEIETGYTAKSLTAWGQRTHRWADGGEPDDLPRVAAPVEKNTARDVFVYFINGAKERAPAAARSLISLL